MKYLKRISLIVCLVMFAVLLTGCGTKNVEGSLEEIMEKVYANVNDDEKPMGLTNIKITDENIEQYLGKANIEYEEALASESMVGSIAHSVVLVRAKKGANIEAIENEIEKNADPRKWVCVGVEEDDVIVESEGDLVILIMVEDEKTREKLDEAFDNLLRD